MSGGLIARAQRDSRNPPPWLNGGATAKRWINQTLIYVLLALYALASLYPFLWMISASLKDSYEIVFNDNLIPDNPTLDTLINTWQRFEFVAYFGNSVVITGATTTGALVVYSLASYAFGVLSFAGRTALYRFFLVLLFVPSVTVLLPVILLERELGILGTHFGLVLPLINGTAPLSILILTAAFQSVPRELREAALMDGSGEWRTLVLIYLPLIGPSMITVGLLTAIPVWNEYILTSVSISQESLYTLPLGLRALQTGAVLEYNTLMAGALIIVIPVVIAFIALQRYFVNGLTGALKG